LEEIIGEVEGNVKRGGDASESLQNEDKNGVAEAMEPGGPNRELA